MRRMYSEPQLIKLIEEHSGGGENDRFYHLIRIYDNGNFNLPLYIVSKSEAPIICANYDTVEPLTASLITELYIAKYSHPGTGMGRLPMWSQATTMNTLKQELVDITSVGKLIVNVDTELGPSYGHTIMQLDSAWDLAIEETLVGEDE